MKNSIPIISLFLIMILSCKSTYKSFHINKSPFIHLDSAQASKRTINFSFSKKETEKWLTYDKRKVKTGVLYFYKNNNKYLKNFPTASLKAESKKINPKWEKEISVKDMLDEFIKSKERWRYKNFKYKLLNSYHKKYGKIYIVKYKDKRGYNYSNSAFLYFYNDYGFIIEYSALEEYFNKFLPDVEKIIDSFTIKE